MTDQLKQLSEAATQGEWTPDPLDDEVISFSEPPSGCLFSEAGNVAFICALVQAYRAGELIPTSEARAQVAVAYEVAADEIAKFQESGMDFEYSLSNEISAIRALTPDHTTTALERVRQQARDEGKREGHHETAYAIEKRAEEIVQNHLPVSAFNELRDASNSIRSDLATLSADTQD